MTQLPTLFLRMWVLRAKPQDLPASKILTHMLLATFVLVSLASMFREFGLVRALVASLIDTALLVAPVVAMLAISGNSARGYQTVSAILGTSTLLVVTLVFLGMFISSPGSLDATELLVLVWYLLIFGHVLRQAVHLPVVLGATFAFIYVMVSNGLIRALFVGVTGLTG